jgi:hypothetical protein
VPPAGTLNTHPLFHWQGFNLTSWFANGFAAARPIGPAIEYIVDEGSNFVAMDWAVNFADDGTMVPLAYQTNHPPMGDIAAVAAQVKAKGLVLCLKPHCTTTTSYENRNVWNSPASTFLPSNFFPAWKSYLLSLLDAVPHVDGLCIGTELNNLDTGWYPDWSDLVAAMRSKTAAWLTYDAIFSRSANVLDVGEVVLWPLVDYIGVSLYVPVSANDNATIAEITAAWSSNVSDGTLLGDVGDVITYLKGFAARYGKPLLAIEGGYQSASGALYKVNDLPSPAKAVNYDLQSRGLQVWLSELSSHQGPLGALPNWLAGVSLWQVNPIMMAPDVVDQLWVTQQFTTYQKPAAQVIANAYWRR